MGSDCRKHGFYAIRPDEACPLCTSLAPEYKRGWSDCMALWRAHMERLTDALAAPSDVGWANRAAEMRRIINDAVASAPEAVNAKRTDPPA